MGRTVQFEMNPLLGISFAMNMHMSSNHLVFPPRDIEHDIELLPGATP